MDDAIKVSRTDPTIKRICTALGYAGRKIRLSPCAGKVTLSDTYWGGGTRSTYYWVELATGKVVETPRSLAAPREYGGKLEGETVELPRGVVCVEWSIFCGKDVGLYVHVRADDLAPLLTA